MTSARYKDLSCSVQISFLMWVAENFLHGVAPVHVPHVTMHARRKSFQLLTMHSAMSQMCARSFALRFPSTGGLGSLTCSHPHPPRISCVYCSCQVSVIPGPTLSQSQFEERQDHFKQSEVICYCTVGLRSAKYAQQLRDKGYNAANLEGSILQWVSLTCDGN